MGARSTAAVLAGVGTAGALAARWMMDRRRREMARSLVEDQPEPTRRIVVLGAGFGGLYAAMHMARAFWDDPETEVLLVDRQNYHLFTPMLTLVAGSSVEPRHVTFPVRRLLRDHHLSFRRAEVQSIDLEARTVTTDSGPLKYDKLVIALGSVPNYFGMKEIEEFGFSFKSVADALEIRNHIVDCFERASIATDRAERQALLTLVIVGGGPTGVELAASLHEFIHQNLAEEYPNISFEREVRIVLFEMKSRVLPNLEVEIARTAARMLRQKAVELRMNTAIDRVWEGGVSTKDGDEVPTHTLIWVAGVQASPVVSGLSVEKGRGGAVVVDDCLRVQGQTGVYALGDNAAFTDPETAKPLPPDAKVAIQQAVAAGENVVRELRGQDPEPFHYRRFGDMISLGSNAAVADVLGVKLSGHAAWLLWRTFYLGRLQGMESKFRVFADWALGTFFERYTAQLELE
jgi:NADH:ubiquinone reductase (H+-translocating)